MKVERPRRAKITDARKRPKVNSKVRNLQQPRNVALEGDWDQLLKRAVAQSVKVAQEAQFGESEEITNLLRRVGQVLEEQFPGTIEQPLDEWVAEVSTNPAQTAQVFSEFGRLFRAPLFTQIGRQIGGQQTPNRFSRLTDAPELGVAPDRSSPDLGARLRRFSPEGAYAAVNTEGYAPVQDAFDWWDIGQNALDLAVINPTASMAIQSAGELGAPFIPMAVSPAAYQAARPELAPYLRMADQTIDLIDARNDLARLESAGADERAVAAARQRVDAESTQLQQEAQRVTGEDVPSDLSNPNYLRQLLRGAGRVSNRALLPTFMPAMETASMGLGDVARDISRETQALPPDSPALDGRYLSMDVGEWQAGTRITPEIRQQLAQQYPGQSVLSVSQRGQQLADAWATGVLPGLIASGGERAARLAENPTRTAGRLAQAAMDVAAAHQFRTALREGMRGTASVLARAGAGNIGRAVARRMPRGGTLATRAGQGLGHMARAAARRVPALQRVGQAFEAMRRSGLGQRVLSQTAQQAGQRLLSRPNRFLRMARPGLTGAVLMRGAESLGDLIYYSTDEGFDDLTQQGAELGVSDLTTPTWQRIGRDLLSLPEALVWSGDHARARLMTALASRGLSDPERNRAYNEARRDFILQRDVANAYPQVEAQLRQALPGLDDEQLTALAAEATINQVYSRHGQPGYGARRQVSDFEEGLLSHPQIARLPSEQQQRLSELTRVVGPQAVWDVFFEGSGDQQLRFNQNALNALAQGADTDLGVEITAGGGYLAGGGQGQNIVYENPYDDGTPRYRTEEERLAAKQHRVDVREEQLAQQQQRQQFYQNLSEQQQQRQQEHQTFLSGMEQQRQEARQRAAQLQQQQSERHNQYLAQHRQEMDYIARRSRETRGAPPPRQQPQQPVLAQRPASVEPAVPSPDNGSLAQAAQGQRAALPTPSAQGVGNEPIAT